MKFDSKIVVYGDTSFRGDCPSETVEQVTFVNHIRRHYPDSYGKLLVHIRNEGVRSFSQAARHKAEGMTKGASDLIIPSGTSFVCELKRKDHTKCRWQEGQQEYLIAASEAGAFACVALGWEAALQAFNDWLK